MPELCQFSFRVAAIGRRLLGRHVAVPLLGAGLMLGCSGPAPGTAQASAAAADQPPAIQLSWPRLSPDGTVILFAFQYGNLLSKLAVVSADPADTRVLVQPAPPGMHWMEPAWAPDQSHFVATSYCEGDNCYEDARGHHIWRFAVRPGSGNLQRLTPNREGVRRGIPFFGRDAGEVYWVLSADTRREGARPDVGHRFIAKADAGREVVLFPDDADFMRGGAIRSAKAGFSGIAPAQSFSGDSLYFVGNPGSGTLPAMRAAMGGKLRHEPKLFRWRGGDALELVRDTAVVAVDAQRSGGGYVTVTRTPMWGDRPSDTHVVRNGVPELRLSFDQGTVASVSVSARMDTMVFYGRRRSEGGESFWLHREGWAQAVDLNIAERVRREVELQIQREAGETTAEREAPRATPAPRRPAAAPR